MQARKIFALSVILAACQSRAVAPAPPPSSSTSAATATAAPRPPAPPPPLDACKAVPRSTQRTTDAKPFMRPSGSCFDGMLCDVVDVPPRGADACFVATTNIAGAETAARANPRGALASRTAWDHARPPKYLDRIDAHLRLDAVASALLAKNGFVVLEREHATSYAMAYHDVFQQQLPVYVSADSILHAVFAANEVLLLEAEKTRLGPRLVRMLERLRATLDASKTLYDVTTWADLDLYVAVPERLLKGEADLPNHADASALVTMATQASGLAEIELFGRARMIDFTQYAPRGHYASWEEKFSVRGREYALSDYFRAMTWLSRLELNLVSRSCRSSQPGAAVDPSETPREARDAIALADLVARSGAQGDVRAFEDVYSVFAGKREDVSPFDVAAFGIAPKDPDAPAKLRARIGDGWRRTANVHFMPEGATDLPAIATLFGERVTPDIAPLNGLVHDRVPNRTKLGAADLGYVLGHDRALVHLRSDLAEHASLEDALEAGRRDLAANTRARGDVYGVWLDAVRALGAPPRGHVPSFMKTDAYADLRLSSALAAYAQIRHTFVLLAAQGYDMYGCEIPDGFVEPALPTYERLLAWARAARAIAPGRAAYFARVESVLGMLRDISRAELEGRALTEPQRRWLGMVSEHTPQDGYGGDSGAPPKYTGWYFDLFPDREVGATRDPSLVADYFTLTNAGEVRYLGVRGTALGVFVVDVGGEPRAMVGPVTLAYETARPLDARLGDEAAAKLDASEKHAPWAASYLAADAEKALDVTTDYHVCADEARVVVRSPEPRDVTVTLLDHHGDPIAPAITIAARADEPAVIAFALPEAVLESRYGVEGLEVKSGAVRERRAAYARRATSPYGP